MPKKVCSVCENDRKYLIFFSKKLSQNYPIDTSKAVFTNLPKSFCQKTLFFSLISESDKNTYNFFKKKYFSSKVSCGHEGFSFDNPVGSLLKKCRKFSLKKRNRRKYTFIPKKTWLERSWGLVEYCVLQRKKNLIVVQKQQRKVFFKQFSSKFIYREVKCSFSTPAERSLPESRFFFLIKVQKRIENSNIFYFLRKYFSSTCSFAFVEYTFHNPIERNKTQMQTFFAHVENVKRNSRLFVEKLFRSNSSCNHVESSFVSSTAFVSSKGRNFFSQCPKSNKNLDSSFWQPCWKIFDWLP